jgi:hypothetical protein
MKRLKRYLRSGIIAAVAIVGIRFTQDLQDWSKLLAYQPSPEIVRLATTTTMTDTARRLFYVNQPTIETSKSSLNFCNNSEQTIILGCYVSSKGIFLQAVTDPRLQGLMEVTAAHEMLHVAYHRMSLFEQTQINKQLQMALAQLQNPRILHLIETYNRQDPKSVDSELHSILGTEVQQLSAELEQHYRTYFIDRLSVVALSERYEGMFTTLQAKAKILSQQLATQNLALDRLSAQVKQADEAVESERSHLKSSILTDPHSDYSFRVSTFNNQVQDYNQLLSQLQSQNHAYNQLLTERNALTSEQKSLFESMENKSTPQVAR